MTSSRKSRVRLQVGNVVTIPLDSAGLKAYGIVLGKGEFAIFDARETLPAEEILQHDPLFYVTVMDRAVTSGRWPVLDISREHVPELTAPPTFMQDPFNPRKLQIYDRGTMRPADRNECIGLERTAVWDPEHVEDRLRDAYAGRENKWLKSLQMIDE